MNWFGENSWRMRSGPRLKRSFLFFDKEQYCLYCSFLENVNPVTGLFRLRPGTGTGRKLKRRGEGRLLARLRATFKPRGEANG